MKEAIAKEIVEQFKCSYFQICDESHQHHGHKGVDRAENTHYRLTIVSDQFENKSLVARQRLVNTVCQPFFKQGMHACALKTLTTAEWEKVNG